MQTLPLNSIMNLQAVKKGRDGWFQIANQLGRCKCPGWELMKVKERMIAQKEVD